MYYNLFKQTLISSSRSISLSHIPTKARFSKQPEGPRNQWDSWFSLLLPKSCKRDSCHILFPPPRKWHLSPRPWQRWERSRVGGRRGGFGMEGFPVARLREHETLLSQAAFRKQKIPAQRSGLFWKARRMAHLRTEFGSICSWEGGWLSAA